MSQIRYCPKCEGIVEPTARRCTICKHDLTADPALLQPPSSYRQQAEMQAAQEAEKPSMALGVMAWIAQVISATTIAVFCILPVVALVITVIVLLFSRG